MLPKLKQNPQKLKQNSKKLKQNSQKLNKPEISVATDAAKTTKKNPALKSLWLQNFRTLLLGFRTMCRRLSFTLGAIHKVSKDTPVT